MTSWRAYAGGAALLLLCCAPLTAARAGQTLLDPGAADTVDTGQRGSYTTLTIRNLGDQPGRVEFGPPIGRGIDIPPGGKVELDGNYNTPGVKAVNRGPTKLQILSRYLTAPTLP